MSIPAAILMSGTGSNARKLVEYASANLDIRLIISDNPRSNYRKIADQYGIPGRLHDIYRFFGQEAPGPGGLAPEARRRLRDRERRQVYDKELAGLLESCGIRLVATAGYDWILSPFLCRQYIIINVHPGDLRVTDQQGQRKYIGLGWIPSAKALLAGEGHVHSCTHLVTEELDGGPIARVSQGVAVNLPESVTPARLLPPGASLGEVIRDINRDAGRRFGQALIYTHAKKLQEALKRVGDWVEFPRTLHQVAELMLQGSLIQGEDGALRLRGRPVRDLFLS